MKKDFEKLSRDVLAQFSCEDIIQRFGNPTHEIGELLVEKAAMTDGVLLYTQVLLPKAQDIGKAFPVVLIRNPYIALADASLYRFYNLYGYGVVYQEVRGKGQSEGEFEAWDHERSDGIDTVHWLQKQPWYNGQLYLVGSSYTAFVHLTMLDEIMNDVKGAVLRVFSPDFRRALYENGVWHLDMITPWVINTALDFMDDEQFLEKYDQALSIRPFDQAVDKVMGKAYPWHQGMIENPDGDAPFWKNSHWGHMCALPEKMTIPVLLIDGWYDPFCAGLIRMWDRMPKETKKKSAMLIGPWVHDCVVQEGCDFPMAHGEILGTDGSLGFLDWLNFIQYGKEPILSVPGKIRYYVMGSDEWKCTDTFNYIKIPDGIKPYSNICRKRFYLDEQTLVIDVPEAKTLTYEYDPKKPDAFRGGEYFNNYMPGGIFRQAKPFRKNSVLNFVSAPFTEDMELKGYVDIFLEVSSDCEETVFIARLDVVNEAGAWNAREGAAIMSKGVLLKDVKLVRPNLLGQRNTQWVHLRLWPCAWYIKAGWQLRLDIASSNYPAYLPHGNVNVLWSKQVETKTAHNTIHIGAESFIEISSIYHH